ncbi:hypothetical protein ACE6H2_019875 [Prunus campanulata]
MGGEGFVDVDVNLETNDDGNVYGYEGDEEIVNDDRFDEAFVVPAAEHIHCVRHLHANFKASGHDSLALKQRL